MVNCEILESHPVKVLKQEISATNIKGYSKMKKAELVELMLRSENKRQSLAILNMQDLNFQKRKKQRSKRKEMTSHSKKPKTFRWIL